MVVSYIGYKNQTIAVGNHTQLTVKLEPDTKTLDEVVVVGYGTVKKRDLTGAVVSVKSDDITMNPGSNPLQALQGKVAGLDITKTSGQAGAGVTMLTTGGFCLMLVFSLGYFIYGHNEYSYWVEQNDHIHPGIRKHTYILGIQTDEDEQLVQAFQRASTVQRNLTELDMYEAEKVVQAFNYNYLGSRDETHYFSFGEDDQYAFRIRTDINWTDDTREIQAWQFQLTDERFETIGFTGQFRLYCVRHTLLPLFGSTQRGYAIRIEYFRFI
ncbi:hypothetical protein AXF24_12645 [Streptococcus pneumoniae]|nr:hypothetical protein AWW74_12660 [Streptococcus pneumoniae]KXB94712.1 hypothetical protein AXF24_12645 [Streptococcus pneumoniae]